jgi:hypothetical protein
MEFDEAMALAILQRLPDLDDGATARLISSIGVR